MGAPEDRHVDWRNLVGDGMRHLQNKLIEKEAEVGLFRVFEADVIPGLLQIPEYAWACLNHGVLMDGAPDDLDEAVQSRMRRQEVLHHEDKRFHFVITEAALRYRYCSPSSMLTQLEQLLSASGLPSVKLGVIGFDATYTIGPWHGFWIFDEGSVAIETYSAELKLAEPHEIELYGKVFDSLAAIASYGDAAQQIIQRAIDDLSTEVEEHPPTR